MALTNFLQSLSSYFGFQNSLLYSCILLGTLMVRGFVVLPDAVSLMQYRVLTGNQSSCYFIISTLYNIYLHPLSAFPGPLHYRASIFPWAYHTLRGDLSFVLRHMHEKYGQVVRISPSEVSFSDPSAWKDVYAVAGGKENDKHHKFYSALSFNGLLPDIVLDTDKESHRVLKASMTDGLSDKTVRRQEDLILKYVDLMLAQLNKQRTNNNSGAPENEKAPYEGDSVVVDLTEWFTWFVFDTIADLLSGQSLGCLENMRKSRLVRVLTEVTEVSSMVVVLWHVGLKILVAAVQVLFGHQFIATLDEVKTRIISRRNIKGGRDDLIDPLIRAEKNGVSWLWLWV